MLVTGLYIFCSQFLRSGEFKAPILKLIFSKKVVPQFNFSIKPMVIAQLTLEVN